MKALSALILLAGTLTAAMAQESGARFDVYSPTRATKEWQPNPSLWRELTREQTNAPVTLGESSLRASGPLLDAAETARRARGSRPGLGRTLISIPVGVASLFVPHRMPQPPGGGGRYFAWRDETSSPWIHASAGAAAGAGMVDNPITREPRNGLLNVSWRDERKPEQPVASKP